MNEPRPFRCLLYAPDGTCRVFAFATRAELDAFREGAQWAVGERVTWVAEDLPALDPDAQATLIAAIRRHLLGEG